MIVWKKLRAIKLVYKFKKQWTKPWNLSWQVSNDDAIFFHCYQIPVMFIERFSCWLSNYSIPYHLVHMVTTYTTPALKFLYSYNLASCFSYTNLLTRLLQDYLDGKAVRQSLGFLLGSSDSSFWTSTFMLGQLFHEQIIFVV